MRKFLFLGGEQDNKWIFLRGNEMLPKVFLGEWYYLHEYYINTHYPDHSHCNAENHAYYAYFNIMDYSRCRKRLIKHLLFPQQGFII